MEVKCRIEVKDKNTVTVTEFPCNSFVANFLALIRAGLADASQAVVTISGLSAGVVLSNLSVTAPEASAGYGIVVGTGTTPVSPTDYKLENQIPHGTGSGQLYHRAVSVGSVVVSGNVSKISMTRTLINYTSSDIVVRETGVYAGPTPTMIIRDVLSEPVTVKAMGGAIVVSYTIEI